MRISSLVMTLGSYRDLNTFRGRQEHQLGLVNSTMMYQYRNLSVRTFKVKTNGIKCVHYLGASAGGSSVAQVRY